MDIHNRIRLGLIVIAIGVLTLHVWISDVNGIFPFDLFMTPKTDESRNKTSEDLSKAGNQENMDYPTNTVKYFLMMI